MKKEITLILMVVAIVGLSGCTSSSGTNATKDLALVAEPSVHPNGPDGEWLVVGNLQSKSNKKYDSINVTFTGYDSSGKVLVTKNVTLPTTYYQVVLKTSGTIEKVDVNVTGAV